MNLLRKIKEWTIKKDKSPELKKQELNQILIYNANKILPDFEFVDYKNNCYTFQRLRQINKLTLYETIHIVSSLKQKHFVCSIASRLNPELIFDNQYNNGIINPHLDLKVLKYNSRALDVQEAYYFHNGQVKTATKIVKEIFKDYKKFGLPFLDKQLETLKSNNIIKSGFDYLDTLQINKESLKKEITDQLNKGDLSISSIKHPIFVSLKEKLQSQKGQSKVDRQNLPKTTYELLELYWKR